jgi:hypothetical protein
MVQEIPGVIGPFEHPTNTAKTIPNIRIIISPDISIFLWWVIWLP